MDAAAHALVAGRAPVALAPPVIDPRFSVTAAISPSVLTPIAATLQNLASNSMALSWGLLGLTGSVAWGAFAALVHGPAMPTCDDLGQGATIRAQLTCLQGAIAAGDGSAIAAGLAWVGSWEPTHPLFNEGADLLAAWSSPVLHQAHQAREAGDWATAINLAAQVPVASPRFSEAQGLLHDLGGIQSQAALAHYETAQTALRQQDWATALQSLWQMRRLEHPALPSDLAPNLARQIEAERQAARLFEQAWQLAALGTPAERGQAIAIACQIDPQTYFWQTVQPQLNQWRDELLLAAGDRSPASMAAHRIPSGSDGRAAVLPSDNYAVNCGIAAQPTPFSTRFSKS